MIIIRNQLLYKLCIFVFIIFLSSTCFSQTQTWMFTPRGSIVDDVYDCPEMTASDISYFDSVA